MFPSQNAQPQMPPQGGAQPPQPTGAPSPQGQPQGGAPQGGAAQRQIMQLPPEIAQHIDPNNAIQMLLLQRIDKFTPADGAAMQQLTPQQVATLKKVLPEVGFLLDMIHAGQMPGQGGAMPPGAGAPANAPMPPQGGAQPPMPAPQPQPPQGGSALRRF